MKGRIRRVLLTESFNIPTKGTRTVSPGGSRHANESANPLMGSLQTSPSSFSAAEICENFLLNSQYTTLRNFSLP